MPSFISYDYQCSTCANIWDELVQRDAVPDQLPCPVDSCGGTGERRISCMNITKASWPDGFKRNTQIREQQKLRKEMSKALRGQDIKEARRVAQEQGKLASTVKETKIVGGVE